MTYSGNAALAWRSPCAAMDKLTFDQHGEEPLGSARLRNGANSSVQFSRRCGKPDNAARKRGFALEGEKKARGTPENVAGLVTEGSGGVG